MSLSAPLALRLDDEKTERVRRDHAQKIVEVQGQPFVTARVIANVQLADGIVTNVPHGLGRAPVWVRESTVRGAASTGRIEEIRSQGLNRKTEIQLKATGWGATVIVDVVVV